MAAVHRVIHSLILETRVTRAGRSSRLQIDSNASALAADAAISQFFMCCPRDGLRTPGLLCCELCVGRRWQAESTNALARMTRNRRFPFAWPSVEPTETATGGQPATCPERYILALSPRVLGGQSDTRRPVEATHCREIQWCGWPRPAMRGCLMTYLKWNVGAGPSSLCVGSSSWRWLAAR